MNFFNKTEVVGLFASVAVMALALAFVRFKTDIFAEAPLLRGDSQSAIVAVSSATGDATTSALRGALEEASTGKGDLVKLVVDDIVIGTGPKVKNGDTVTVNYEGRTQSGVTFDSSYERGTPFTFTVGAGKVIEGWEKGLVGMQVGGKRILVIPADMAYGNRQVGVIPANSPLVFSIELLKIE
ncbi:MAG TPA: FKBP-type peptidyl-prolyl cis-trans isomerase [Candidatus Paceibacterota bacterium]|nr:FKBP-type peptidyl-prolyl cis-trans isomerase [Candidatus Paceibacterota bacterium]